MSQLPRWSILIGAVICAGRFYGEPLAGETGQQQTIRVSDVVSGLESKANNGDIVAQAALGAMYFDGIGLAVDKKKAFYWNQKAADKGNVLAIYNLSQAYADPYPSKWSGDPEENTGLRTQWLAKAFDAAQPLAEKGDVEAMYVEGMISLHSGRYGLAEKWLTAAAQKDYPPAQVGLAQVIRLRIRDSRAIIGLNTSAARTGSSTAMFALGMSYEDAGDKAKAEQWLLRSASLNNLNAIEVLCNTYKTRVGNLPDIAYGPNSCSGASRAAALANDPTFQAFSGAMAFGAALALMAPKLPPDRAAEAQDYTKQMIREGERLQYQTTKDFGCDMARVNKDAMMAAMVGGCP